MLHYHLGISSRSKGGGGEYVRVPPLEERTAVYGREHVRCTVQGSNLRVLATIHLGGKGREGGKKRGEEMQREGEGEGEKRGEAGRERLEEDCIINKMINTTRDRKRSKRIEIEKLLLDYIMSN